MVTFSQTDITMNISSTPRCHYKMYVKMLVVLHGLNTKR